MYFFFLLDRPEIVSFTFQNVFMFVNQFGQYCGVHLSYCRIIVLSNYRIVELSNYRIVELSYCRIIVLSGATIR